MLRLNDILLITSVFSAMGVGIFLPKFGNLFQPYTLYLMMFLLFLSFLSVELADVRRMVRDRAGTVLWLSFLKLTALPVAAYYLFLHAYPDYAVAALLLAGASTAVIAPFMSGLVGGNTPLVLVITVFTSLVMPLVLPVLVGLLVGSDVRMPLPGMMRTLAMVIFVPVAAKEILSRALPPVADRLSVWRFPLSVACMMMVTMGVFSKYAEFFHRNPQTILEALLVVMALGGIFFAVGIGALWGKSVADQTASVVSLGHVNNVLVVVFASELFGPLETTLSAVYVFPFFGLILPIRLYQAVLRSLRP